MKAATIGNLVKLGGLGFASAVFLYLAITDGGSLRWVAGVAFAIAFVVVAVEIVRHKPI